MNFIKGKLVRIEENYFIEPMPGENILLGNKIPAAIKSKAGNEIEIGIRPENIILRKNNISAIQGCQANVAAFENMGNEQLIYLAFQGHNIIARNSTQEIIEIGDNYFIQFLESEIIFPDPVSGEILYHII